MVALLLTLICCDDAALAGAAYRDALEALKQARYDDAVARLQEALRLEPRETEKLLYRDRDGRHADPYHPHLVWSRTRLLQARGEADPAVKMKLLREALTHLDLTDSAPPGALRDTLKRDLAEAEKAVSAPPAAEDPSAALRRKLSALCDQERFEQALEAAETPDLAELVESRRRPVLLRYEQAMTLALEAVAITSPVEKPEAIPLILQPALLPASVSKNPGPRPSWYRDFLALVERRLPQLRGLSREPEDRLIDAAQAFDRCAASAAEASWLPAFRAAAHLADAIRSSRLGALEGGREDVALDKILDDLDRSLRQREDLLSKTSSTAAELKACREGFLAPTAAQARKTRERREARGRLRDELRTWTAAAEAVLSDPARMGHPAALRAVSRDAADLKIRPAWPELDPSARSRVLYMGGLLDLVAALLESGPQADLREPLAALRTARDLDPAAGRDWEPKLSPKLRARLAETGR